MTNFGSEPYLISIGSNCTITSGVKFITHDASIENVLRYKGIARTVKDKKYELMGKIEVLDNCMIGINSIILQGVTIGPNSIVGAGSIVTKNVPPGVIVAGNPAKTITTLDDYYLKLDSNNILLSYKTNSEKRKEEILRKLEAKK